MVSCYEVKVLPSVPVVDCGSGVNCDGFCSGGFNGVQIDEMFFI